MSDTAIGLLVWAGIIASVTVGLYLAKATQNTMRRCRKRRTVAEPKRVEEVQVQFEAVPAPEIPQNIDAPTYRRRGVVLGIDHERIEWGIDPNTGLPYTVVLDDGEEG